MPLSTKSSLIQAKPHHVLVGDCLKKMPSLPTASMDLIFADPPFNNDWGYDLHKDKLTPIEYTLFTRKWLTECKRLLKPNGSIYVAINTKWQAMVRVEMDKLFHWRDTICSHYTFGEAQQKKFTSSWIAIHYCLNSPKDYVFNADSIRVPSARQLKYKDKRAVSHGKLPDNLWILAGMQDYESNFNGDRNVWLESRVCGTFKDRELHPCQMNQNILDRIVKVSSNVGDVVFDPFLGSGTTMAAALENGRRCVGIELSQRYVDDYIQPRVERTMELYGRKHFKDRG